MFLKLRYFDDPYYYVSETIKRDLISTLRRKGINIANVRINMKPGNLNVEFVLKDKAI